VYCPTCGKPIPDGSQFCMHCGTAVPEAGTAETAPPGGEPSGDPPEGIGIVLWDYSVPTRSRKWYSGFEVWFSLLDSSGRPTRSDGELTLVFDLKRMFRGHRVEVTTPVRGEDFAKVAEGEKWPAGGFGHLVQTSKAVLRRASDAHGKYQLDVSFKTPDGQELSGQGSFLHPIKE
jgi:hypothetical protein